MPKRLALCAVLTLLLLTLAACGAKALGVRWQAHRAVDAGGTVEVLA